MNKIFKIEIGSQPIVTLKDIFDVEALLFRESKDSYGNNLYTLELVMSQSKNIFLIYEDKEYRDRVAAIIERSMNADISDAESRKNKNYKAC